MPPRGPSACAVCGCPIIAGEMRWCVAQMLPELSDGGGEADALLAHERCVPWQAKGIPMPYLGAVEAWRLVYRRLARAEHREVAAYVAKTGRALMNELARWPERPLARLEAVRRLGVLVQGAVESHGVGRITGALTLPGGAVLGDGDVLEKRGVRDRVARDRGAYPHPRDLERMIQKLR